MVTPPAAVTVSHHPLVLDKLTRLRDRTTEPPVFRALVRDLSWLLFYEAIQDVQLETVTVTTPLAPAAGQRMAERIGLVPILRAGLGMADAILQLVPEARVWHLGLYRDHDTHLPVTYYNKLPADAGLDLALVVDPMLATGGSAVEALTILKKGGVRRLKFLAQIAAPEGVHTLTAAHPDVPLFLGAIDSHLDSHCYIIPGLGDAGDRQFGTH
jgi:uracil phosphoribosyltransferase